MDLIWRAGKLGPMELKNRTVRSATNEHLSEANGQLTRPWMDAQIELARGQVGLVITGHFCVDRGQRADEGQCVLDEETNTDLLQQAVEGVHCWGSRLVVQLSHSGPKAMEKVNGRPAKYPEDFTVPELDRLVEQFVYAAKRCQDCGADGVQIHTAHGYLLSSFLNPEMNRRTDEYGGSLECRFRLIRRILRGVREACGPGFALLVKADCNGCGDFPGLLRLYQDTGVDGVEVSGLDFNGKAGQKTPFYLHELLAAREGISVPVILVGGMFSKREAEEVLAAGIDFVAFSRALICQPDFVANMKEDPEVESRCLACNGCYTIYRKRPVRCVQHQDPIPQLSKVFF